MPGLNRSLQAPDRPRTQGLPDILRKRPDIDSLSRRSFLKLLAGTLAGAKALSSIRLWPSVDSCQAQGSWSDGDFKNRAFYVSGERYTVSTPDTLDLQTRAQLAINALTRMAMDDNDSTIYGRSDIYRNPPVLLAPEPIIGKYYEAVAMMRLVTGSTLNLPTDQRWRRAFLEWLANARPVMHGPDLGRCLSWMAVAYQVEQDPAWLDLMNTLLNDMRGALVRQNGYAFFPREDGSMPTGWDATYAGWTIQGLAQVYAIMHLSLAGELAAQLARYLKDHAQVFDEQAHFLARHPSERGPILHFHHNGNALVGLAEYASAAGDADIAAFARQGYEWARSLGSPLVGFFPEYIDDPPGIVDLMDCETCCTADMIKLALLLTGCGQGDYWDDVDRYLRNQFAEMQLLNGDWIDERAATLPPTPVGPEETADQVSQRIVGGFASWSSANDFVAYDPAPGVTFCCVGNGARAMYFTWERMLDCHAGQVTVHLLLNRPSDWVDVHSCLPVEGRVELQVKRPCALLVRLPEWVTAGEAGCTMNGAPRALEYSGRYAKIGQVAVGQTVTMTFPVAERTVPATIGKQPYTLTLRGNDVVGIDPPGIWYPYYQREHYRTPPALWISRERFVADVYDHPGA